MSNVAMIGLPVSGSLAVRAETQTLTVFVTK